MENAGKNKTRWGFRLHVLPDFTPVYLQKLTQEMMARNDLVLPATDKWTLELDHELVEMASEFCYVSNRDIMKLFPGFLVPNDRLLMKYGKLIDFTLSQIQMRFYLLQQLNVMLRDILPFINISCDDASACRAGLTRSSSTLAKNIRMLRGLIFRTVKDQWLDNVLSPRRAHA